MKRKENEPIHTNIKWKIHAKVVANVRDTRKNTTNAENVLFSICSTLTMKHEHAEYTIVCCVRKGTNQEKKQPKKTQEIQNDKIIQLVPENEIKPSQAKQPNENVKSELHVPIPLAVNEHKQTNAHTLIVY